MAYMRRWAVICTKLVSVLCLTATLLLLSGRDAVAQGTALPGAPPWQSIDVGAVGTAGSASDYDGDLSVAGAGSDIWGTADSFHFVYRPIEDGQISARFGGEQNTDPFAKAGVMIRQTLDPSSPEVILDVKPDGGVEFMTRPTQGGDTTFIAGGSFSGYKFLVLLRTAGTVSASICTGIGETNPGPCQFIGSISFPSGPALIGAAVTSHNPMTLNHALFPGTPVVYTVPQPFYAGDFGTVGLAGSSFFHSGTFTVNGAGADIWGTSDSFQEVQQCFVGDGEVMARVTAEQAANAFAKAGVMIRNNTGGSGTATVIADVKPDGGIELMGRATDGASMTFLAGGTLSFPVWLKVQRTGDQFLLAASQDGTTWNLSATTTATMAQSTCILGGLAVTSHDTTALNTSTFDSVFVASQAGSDTDVGQVGVPGSVDVSNGVTTMNGSGADIWGTADAFNFFYQGLLGDGQIIARVTSLQDTNPYAKAGVMIRASTDPSAADVILDVLPGGSIEFMMRDATGDSTAFLAGASTSIPVWLKLARSGPVITGSMSANGSAWSVVGTTTLSIAPDALIGLAVTSHDFGVLNTATFDNLSR
jgi:regulation of enolase protein 1 (concanavalin A-like superfamily)